MMPRNASHPIFRTQGTNASPDRFVYKGYRVQLDMAGRTWFITKDGANIGSSGTRDGARLQIDGITR